jgi:RP/EB family microtubule-associated protein
MKPFPVEHNNRANVAQQRSVFKAESAHKSAANARNVSVVGVDSSVRSTDLDRQITQLQVTVDGLEKERDFYFGKLRDVEVLIQSRLGKKPSNIRAKNYIIVIVDSDADERVATLCKEIQAILYSTEEGFEIPQENQEPVANTEQEIY